MTILQDVGRCLKEECSFLINHKDKIAAINVLTVNARGSENEHTVEFEYKIYDGII